MGDSNTTFENNEITTGSANYEFKYGTDNPFYNYEYSEEVGMYYLYLRNKNMFKLFLAGSIISCIAFIFNIFIFIILFSKRIMSPSTVLMQRLAISDGVTSLCLYGAELLFLGNYVDWRWWDYYYTTVWEHASLFSPYCTISYICVQLADCFYFVSALLTVSLGFQKVLAIHFPIWTLRRPNANRLFVVFCVS